MSSSEMAKLRKKQALEAGEGDVTTRSRSLATVSRAFLEESARTRVVLPSHGNATTL